jgi:hypothetical protein
MTAIHGTPRGPRAAARALAVLSLILASALAGAPSAVGAGALTPLPRSDYAISPVCPPASPGHAACLSLQLFPVTREALARRHPLGVALSTPRVGPSPAAGNFGLRPQDLHSAYALPSAPTSPQTIAIVDAYNDPNAEGDLEAYDQEFGIPECTSGNGCLRQVNQNGEEGKPPFPKSTGELEAARAGSIGEAEHAEAATGWGLELSLDMESAHATCQTCKIMLVLANSEANSDLETAERSAENLGATEITNSWGGLEEGVSAAEDSASPFNHPGTVITASAGDNGYLGWDARNFFERGFAEYPASSPHVVSVGGTRLTLGASGSWKSESVWNGDRAGGGGCSVNFTAPAWQQALANWTSVGCGTKRAVSDVSAVADPYTGFAVRYTSPACEYSYEETGVIHVLHWCTIGGTSLASPVIAAVFALAGGSGAVNYPARTLYENAKETPSSVHDVTNGSNGICGTAFNESTGISGCKPAEEAAASCKSNAICLAGTGYDGPTGVGTPNGILDFKVTEEGAAKGEETPSEEPAEEQHRREGAFPPPAPLKPGPPPAPPAPTGGGSTTVAPGTMQLTGLSLTIRALVALNTRHPRISQVGFQFSSSAAGRVTVTLARRRRAHRRIVWAGVARTMSISVAAGRTSRHMTGRSPLPAGLYRLTLAPAHGAARTLLFQIG